MLTNRKPAHRKGRVQLIDASQWFKPSRKNLGKKNEMSFIRHFYKPQPLRTLEEIRADILAVEKKAEGLLDGLMKGAAYP